MSALVVCGRLLETRTSPIESLKVHELIQRHKLTTCNFFLPSGRKGRKMDLVKCRGGILIPPNLPCFNIAGKSEACRHCCGQLILQGRKTQNQNDNHVLQINLHCTKSFISSVTMETAKICSFTSHLRNMQNILATAVRGSP
jgi:hypothetical protein